MDQEHPAGLNLDYHAWVKAPACLAWIATLIGQNVGRAELVVDVVMRMTVDPEWNPTLFNHEIEVGNKGGTERAANITRGFRTRTGRMMGDHYGLCGFEASQFGFQPSNRCPMDTGSVTRPENALGGTKSNKPVVIQQFFCFRHCSLGMRCEREIGPESTPQECKVAEFDRVVLENVNVAAFGFGFKRLGQIRERVPVKFVVAEHINHRPIWKTGLDPIESLPADVNVTCQHHDVCIGGRDVDRFKFKVEISKDVQAHNRRSVGRSENSIQNWLRSYLLAGFPGVPELVASRFALRMAKGDLAHQLRSIPSDAVSTVGQKVRRR